MIKEAVITLLVVMVLGASAVGLFGLLMNMNQPPVCSTGAVPVHYGEDGKWACVKVAE